MCVGGLARPPPTPPLSRPGLGAVMVGAEERKHLAGPGAVWGHTPGPKGGARCVRVVGGGEIVTLEGWRGLWLLEL